MDRTPEDILDECIERLIGGEPVEALLAAYPGHAATLMSALRSARLMVSAPAARASDAARLGAMRRMLDQLEASAKPQVAGGWLSAFKRRPVAFQAAVLAGGIALFGALGVGASAATGTAPEPVRNIFRLTSSSQIRVEFTGVVTGIDLDADTLDVAAGADVRTVRVTASTKLSRGGDAIAFGDLNQGDAVKVNGTLQADNSVLAKRVHLEGADATVTPGAAALDATPDDGDDDDDDDETRTPKATGTHDDDDSAETRTPDADGDGNDNSGGQDGDDGGTPKPDETHELENTTEPDSH